MKHIKEFNQFLNEDRQKETIVFSILSIMTIRMSLNFTSQVMKKNNLKILKAVLRPP